jgi:hypothetical protein
MPRRRIRARFAPILVVAAAAGALASCGGGDQPGGQATAKSPAQAKAAVGAQAAAVKTVNDGAPFTVFRNADTAHPAEYGFLMVAPLVDGRPGPASSAGLSCSRVAFAAGHGVCLDVEGSAINASLLDSRLHVTHTIKLAGIPSRARISPDGRWAGTTTFVVGHAYAAPGQFSTIATIIDTHTGKPVGTLEKDFKVTVDGHRFDPVDRNYWGLTFAADGDTFYATAASGQKTWLIKGSIKRRTAHSIHSNVECPSLSPDGTRIAYKKAVSHDPTVWRFHVLDLATGHETQLSETRSIDDQLAWLDDEHVMYADEQQRTWVMAANGSGIPQLWMRAADSAVVVRAAGAPSSPAGT